MRQRHPDFVSRSHNLPLLSFTSQSVHFPSIATLKGIRYFLKHSYILVFQNQHYYYFCQSFRRHYCDSWNSFRVRNNCYLNLNLYSPLFCSVLSSLYAHYYISLGYEICNIVVVSNAYFFYPVSQLSITVTKNRFLREFHVITLRIHFILIPFHAPG